MSIIKVLWQVDDGYIGKTRRQSTKINTDDWMCQEEWDELSKLDKIAHIESAVEEDFEQRISFFIDDYGI